MHSAGASAVFNVPMDEVPYDERRKAKVINFGIIYGMGVNALRANLGTTRQEAQKFYDDYFEGKGSREGENRGVVICLSGVTNAHVSESGSAPS